MSFNTSNILAANLRTMHKRKNHASHVSLHYKTSCRIDFQAVEISAETILNTWKKVEALRERRK